VSYGNRFNRTAATTPVFKYLAVSESAEETLVSLTFASWNQIQDWLRRVEGIGLAPSRRSSPRTLSYRGVSFNDARYATRSAI
jgi:hypothetical protein